MKTFTKTFATLISVILFSTVSFSNNFEIAPETYIDDIPFDTEVIAMNALYEMAMAEVYDLEDEEYIDDIPFNTDSIYRDCICKKAMKTEFKMEEETYIDDIPFNTFEIAQKHSLKTDKLIAGKLF